MGVWEGAKLIPVTSRCRVRLALFGLLASCVEPPIAWEEPHDATAGDPGYAPPPVQVSPTLSASRCAVSLRTAQSGAGGWYAAWWALRRDSTAELLVAYSGDGKAWNEPVRVDTVDVGRTGCRRPSPAIRAEGSHVYLTYGMAAREGPGIFASHSMDYGKVFHAPVAVVYGERFGATSVDSRGSTVAVAYEDPNTVPRRIGLAISTTMGHPFQIRTLVSPPTGGGESSEPAVQLGDSGRVRVWWKRMIRGDTTRMMREGRIR